MTVPTDATHPPDPRDHHIGDRTADVLSKEWSKATS